MYKGRSLLVVIALSCLPIASAMAQQTSDLVGEWNGKLENWTIDTDQRKLIVAPDGSCRWGYPTTKGGPGAAKSCSVNRDAGTIELVTSADSAVRLKLNAGNLVGSLQLRNNGVPFPVTLAHGPQPESAPAQEYKWTVQGRLVSGSASFCGFVGERREITIKNNVLVAKSEVGSAWTLSGLNHLKPDGSGEIIATTAQRNHKFIFTFSAGTGPRPITMRDENSPCVWLWAP
jgi:hypothetical protein